MQPGIVDVAVVDVGDVAADSAVVITIIVADVARHCRRRGWCVPRRHPHVVPRRRP